MFNNSFKSCSRASSVKRCYIWAQHHARQSYSLKMQSIHVDDVLLRELDRTVHFCMILGSFTKTLFISGVQEDDHGPIHSCFIIWLNFSWTWVFLSPSSDIHLEDLFRHPELLCLTQPTEPPAGTYKSIQQTVLCQEQWPSYPLDTKIGVMDRRQTNAWDGSLFL